MINKTLTGFMRAEVKREDGQNQSSRYNYDAQGNMIIADQVVNSSSGYTEEYNESNPQNTDTYDDNEYNEGGGLPARLPTEIMNEPPPPEPGQYIANPTDDCDNTVAQNGTLELDQEYYFLNSYGHKMGPFTMDAIVQKYNDNEISDDTQIWSGDQTQNDAKPLKENEKIYSKLPKPPQRKQNQNKQKTLHMHIESNNVNTANNGQTDQMDDLVTLAASNNYSGCCCVVL